MFYRPKYLAYIAMGLLLFACARTENKDVGKTQESPQLTSERNRNPLLHLNTKKQPIQLSEQTIASSDKFIYQSRQKRNTDGRINRKLEDVAPKNVALKGENKVASIQNKTTEISELPAEITQWGLRVIFDNDIWNNTDYYYTNGLAIELLTPLAKNSPINKILLGTKSTDIELNGFSIRQNMYTPTNPDVTEILNNDRPFSAFLTIGHFRETYNFEKRLHIKSALELGVLGPASLGGTIQTGLHTEEPVGWQNQIQNSFVVSYFTEVEKGILQTQNFEFNLKGSVNVGSLFNKASGGFSLRLGHFIPLYRGPMKFATNAGKNSPLQFWFFVKGNTDFVLYDATLQGGLLTNKNLYTIAGGDLNRLVFQASAGIAIYSGRLGIELENFYLSPEFKGGRSFGWGRIKLVAAF